jgi:hypothetical protein
MKTASAFFLGLLVGGAAVLVIARMREEMDSEQELHARMSERIRELEDRTNGLRKARSPSKAGIPATRK